MVIMVLTAAECVTVLVTITTELAILTMEHVSARLVGLEITVLSKISMMNTKVFFIYSFVHTFTFIIHLKLSWAF